MDRTETISNAAGEINVLADYIQNKYKAAGYQTQQIKFEENGISGLTVQIQNTIDDFAGSVKTCIGMKSCAALILKVKGNDLHIDVRAGSWIDKVFSMTIAWIVLWPLMAIGAWGAWTQRQLLEQIFIDTISYFANK